MGSKKTKKPKKTVQSKAQGAFPKGIDHQVIEMTPAQLEAFLAGIKGKVDEKQEAVIVGMAASLQLLIAEVRRGKISIARLKAILFGIKTEKTAKVSPPESAEDKTEDNTSNQDETKKKKKPNKPGHGKNGEKGLPGAIKIPVSHENLVAGDPCPECPKGKMYPLPEHGVMVRFIGMAPIEATVYQLEKFRCNGCGLISTAKAPEGAGTETYDESVAAAVALLKYGAGVPFTRFERLQKHLGVPLPTSNQWERVDKGADLLDPIFAKLINHAAQGTLIHHDDTAMKIMDRPEFRLDKEGKKRSGVYTTAVISHVVADGESRDIAFFMTGMHHGGENLEEVLKKRVKGLNPPIQMCDASANNTKGEFDTILANCLAHGRRKFVELLDYFPKECQRFLGDIGMVYGIDKKAKDMPPHERLLHHQAHSEPIMTELHDYLEKQIDDKLVESNSELGRAIKYMLNHWEALTLFLREPGAPLDNNLAERVIKRAVLHRKNSLYYRSINGAYVGDLFMSLIHTAEMNGANPFDYLKEALKHPALVKENPEEWMPWNYKETLASLPK